MFWWKSFHNPVRKRKQKGRTVINFSLVLVVFKRHHGSEGVKKKNVFVVVGFCFSIFVVGLLFFCCFLSYAFTLYLTPHQHMKSMHQKRQQQKLVTLRPTIWLSWLILSAVMRSKWWRNRCGFGFGCVGALNLRIEWRTGRTVNVFILRQHTMRADQCSSYARVFYCHP